jgi:phosphate transport system substrate-binding protein
MMCRHWVSVLTIAALCAGPLACGGGKVVTIQGSGATFPAPIYKRWFLEFYKRNPNVRVNYTPIGSGAGIRQFSEPNLVVFGASDAGMSKKEIAALPEDFGGVRLLPMTAGSIVLSYNLPGVNVPIRLSRKAYLSIFLAEITDWDDPILQECNPGVKLPALPITVVTRADSSGTTDVFTNHLYAVGQDPRVGVVWDKELVGKSPTWKKSIAAQGNDGVAALIQLTPGAIGYLEFGYAHLANLPTAELQNHYGAYVTATAESGLEALKEGTADPGSIPRDLQIKIPDPKGRRAYPIVTWTWILCRGRYPKHLAREAKEFKEVLRFCLSREGQDVARELDYIPLPQDVADLVWKSIDTIQIEQ